MHFLLWEEIHFWRRKRVLLTVASLDVDDKEIVFGFSPTRFCSDPPQQCQGQPSSWTLLSLTKLCCCRDFAVSSCAAMLGICLCLDFVFVGAWHMIQGNLTLVWHCFWFFACARRQHPACDYHGTLKVILSNGKSTVHALDVTNHVPILQPETVYSWHHPCKALAWQQEDT
jgi:hypothetical protein